MKLCFDNRGIHLNTKIFNNINNIELIYEMPMYEIINNFIDKLKSISNGYASFSYNFINFKKKNNYILTVLINNNKIDDLSIIVNKNNYINISENILDKLKNNIERKQFNIKVQILLNNKIIKKIIIKQYRKNVINKCYGGDITRKKKLLKKQKKGKNKMKNFGKINVTKKEIYKILEI
ncbi:hypothetical protein L7J86_00615 [endosymbiont of Metamasius hemipterus]|uniref:Elongation factor 4 n=2 Tax=Candidatus Nardonella TaxID=204619 RepID=A0ABT0TXH6_9GAMM|nr:hypothetical protein [endosymbiont of Metamasius hemipterus]